MRETQQFFPVSGGFANITAPLAELSATPLETYKALLIELARRDLLTKAQNAHVFLEPRDVLDEDQALLGAQLRENAAQLLSIGMAFDLNVEPSGVTHTSLITSYEFRSRSDNDGVWIGDLVFPPELLQHLALQEAQERGWIEKNVFPATAEENTQRADWAAILLIRCVPKEVLKLRAGALP